MLITPDSVHPYITFWLNVVADKVIKVVALGVGAVWTWLNVHRSRTYKRKLELDVSATIFRKDDEDRYFLISCHLENVGQSKYPITHKGTYVGVLTLSADGSTTRVFAADIFTDHDWIEPGEQVTQPLVLPIPSGDFIALKLALRVISENIEWNASNILTHGDIYKELGGKHEVPGSET